MNHSDVEYRRQDYKNIMQNSRLQRNLLEIDDAIQSDLELYDEVFPSGLRVYEI